MAEARALWGLRGATTVEADTEEEIAGRVQALVTEMMERNGVGHDDVVSILFTATPDIGAMFPATAARALGLGDVPLICAQEIAVPGATPLCIRVLMHLYTHRDRADLHHVYLEGARTLRDDLPE